LLTAKLHSRYSEESESGVGIGSRKFWKCRSWSRTFDFRLRNPGWKSYFSNMWTKQVKTEKWSNLWNTLSRQLTKAQSAYCGKIFN